MSPRDTGSTRDRLLAEGVEAFRARGYNATGVQHIVGAAGVPKGSFYNYFPSKEALAVAAIESYAAKLRRRLLRELEEAADTETTAIETFDRQLHNMIRLEQEDRDLYGCLLGSLAAEVAATSAPFRDALAAAFSSWQEPFRELVERGQADGSIRDDVPAAELADVFLDLWEGSLLRMKVERSCDCLEARRRFLVDHLLARR